MATKFILVTIWTIQGWLTGSVGLQLPSHIKTHEELISQHSNLVHRIRKKNSHNLKKKDQLDWTNLTGFMAISSFSQKYAINICFILKYP